MRIQLPFWWVAIAICLAVPIRADAPSAVTVHHAEGLVHGFLVLRTTNNDILADGDLMQTTIGTRVTSHLVFHFKDGSINDETVVYSQRRTFRLLKYHLVQKGPAFKQPIDFTIDGTTGQTTVHHTDEDGKEKEINDRLKLPANLANGMVPTLLKNIPPNTAQIKLSMIVATPKPRMIGLTITPAGEDSFTFGSARKALHYVVKVEIGGVAGVVAPLVGKQPPDSHIWILEGDAPTFLKSEGPLFANGPSWRIELSSPTWP